MTLPRDVDAYLTRRFFDPTKPGSYTSVSKLYQVIKSEGKYNISMSRIKEWASRTDILSLHKQVRQTQPKYRRIIAPSINHLLDADLMVLTGERFKIANKGHGYVLVTIDVFSRFCRARAVKSKSGEDISHAFELIFDEMTAKRSDKNAKAEAKTTVKVKGNAVPATKKDINGMGLSRDVGDVIGRSKESPILPLYCRTDSGKEFTNAKVQKVFSERGITHLTSSTESKANYSESLIKNIKKRLFQYFQSNSTYAYLDVLQQIVRSYNNTVHTSIAVTPSSVTDENTQDIWDYQYITQNTRDLDKLFVAAYNSSVSRNKKKYTFALGDRVRISYKRSKIFHRAFDQQFSSEIFSVRDRKISDGIALYYLRDYSGEQVKGAFYTNELTPVTFDPDNLFKIDKVIKTRTVSIGRKKIKESLVRYEGWPAKYNQWIPSSSLKAIGKRKS